VFHALAVKFDIAVAEIQKMLDVEPVQALDPQKMPVGKGVA
jgi:hypothetical protein